MRLSEWREGSYWNLLCSDQPRDGASCDQEDTVSAWSQILVFVYLSPHESVMMMMVVVSFLPRAVSKVSGEVSDLEAGLLEVDIDPVLEGVCLDLYPLLLPTSNVHRLGGVTLG